MVSSENRPESPRRRSVLRLAALAGGFGAVPSVASASGEPSRSERRASDTGEAVELGDFESGLDGWTTTGGNDLFRVSSDDLPTGVVNGQFGVAVEIDGDAFPMIENKKRVKDADFLNYPFLHVHVLAHAEDTDSDLAFQFRLHHRATPANGSRTQGPRQGKEVLVEESDRKEVPQLTPRRIQWDMSDLPREVLESANRLEIVWYLADHEPDGGHRGRSDGDVDFRGIVAFDDIRLSESAPVSQAHAYRDEKMNLHRKHGMIVDRVFEEQTEDFERGTLVFVDGTEVSFEFEALADGRFIQTIDGETFEIGGGEE